MTTNTRPDNVFSTLQSAILAVRSVLVNPAAAPVRDDLARIEAELIATCETLSRCNIDTVQP
jgi:hypothetical protein